MTQDGKNDQGIAGDQASTRAGAAVLEGDRGGIVTARGTGDGLVVRLDGRVGKESLKEALAEFLHSRRGFLTGNEVALEWVGLKPDSIFVDEVSMLLLNEFDITVRSSELWEQPRTAPSTAAFASEASQSGPKIVRRPVGMSREGGDLIEGARSGRAPSLFDGIEVFAESEQPPARERAPIGVDSSVWDDPDARFVYATLRGGQRIETEHSLVVFGDVNSGAEVVAGGDIVVLGALRGIAHAGAYDETGGGRVIFALNLQPTQLRIGITISRGSSDASGGAEVARVEGNLIVVEPYNSRKNWSRR